MKRSSNRVIIEVSWPLTATGFSLARELGLMGPESTSTPEHAHSASLLVASDELIADRYRVVETLATGGFGQVVAARDEDDGSRVAIKVLRDDAGKRDPAALARMRQEAEILGAIDHPHIVRVFDVGRDECGQFMVMELLDGPTVAELLESEGPAPPERVAPLVEQLLSALATAHQKGVLHRDIKPSNIVLVEGADGSRAKLVDFGIAKVDQLLDDDPDEGVTLVETRGGDFVGTPRFCAPEAAVGDPAGPSADLFSLGLVLAEWLTGTPRIDTDRQDVALGILIRPDPLDVSDCPPHWQPWLSRMLEKSPEERYASADEALDQFRQRVIEGEADPKGPDETQPTPNLFEIGDDNVSESAETNVRLPPSAAELDLDRPRGFDADLGPVPRPEPPEADDLDEGVSFVQFVLVAAASCAAILLLWTLARTFLA